MATTLRAYDRAGARVATLSWSALNRTIVRNAAGALTSSAPLSLIPAGLLDSPELYLRVAENGVEADDWYLLDDDGDDPTDEGGRAREVVLGGKGVLACLEWAEVYPWDHVPGGTLLGLKPEHPFNDTPGAIMGELLRRAQARGAIPHITWSFTDTHDSAGRPWPTTFARVYEAGQTLFKVVETMVEDAWADVEMRGFELRLYVPDTELAADRPDVVLRLGQGVTQAPRKRTRAAVRSTILAAGSEGAIIEVVDPDALAKYGRREGYEGRSGITDVGTLTAATQVSLQRQTSASESFTLALDPSAMPEDFPGVPRPGHYIRYDQRRLSPTQLEPMRVQSVAWEYGEEPVVSVELADLWVDRDVRLERRVDAILNGSTANERAPQPPLGDEKPPSTPTGLALVSAPYEDPTTGTQYAQATATWMPVTTDVDGTPVGELKGYRIQWRQAELSAAIFEVDAGAGATMVSWSPIVPGTEIEARIAAYDRWDNYSTWSPWTYVMAGVDETAPSRPTGVSAGNYNGLYRSGWDGSFAGAARPADLSYVEVHLSSLNGFVPDEDDLDATLVGTLFAPGYVYTDIDRAPYGQTRYMRMVAVDTSGNRSEPSVQVSAATGQVVSSDLFDGIIDDSRLMADVAIIRTVHIDELNLNSARVSTIDVGKVKAGTITADWLMAGTMRTGTRGTPQAPTVPIVEINGLGIFRFDGTGTATVAIDANGALVTGRYRTSISGRRIEMGSAGFEGRIDFYSPGTYHGFVRSFSEGNGTEAIQFGMQVPGLDDSLWNRINYNASPRGEYATYKSGTHEFTFDVGPLNIGGRFVVYQGYDRGKDSNYYVREQIDGGGHFFNNVPGKAYTFRWHENPSWFEILPGDNWSSAGIRLNNGIGYGGLIKFYTQGGNDPQRIEFLWADSGGYYALWAQAFVVQSDAGAKSEIKVADRQSMLTQVRDSPPATYRRHLPTPEGKAKGRRAAAPLGPVEVGLVAQDAPAQIVTGTDARGQLSIDLYQMAATNWGATGHLADIVEAQGKEIARLTELVTALVGEGTEK